VYSFYVPQYFSRHLVCYTSQVVTAKNYSIIQGFPGTGKTSTIVFIARLMMAMGKRVLVTSYTHSAVDNILLKLVGGSAHRHGSYTTDVVRVGRKHSVHPALHRYLTSDLASEMDQQEGLRTGSLASDGDTNADKNPSIANLHKVISSAKVVGVSALTVPKSPLLIGQKFDLVIVDEAGQISQPAIIGALLAAESFVLVGDHEQLPPLVQSDVAEKAGECYYYYFTTLLLESFLINKVIGYSISMLKRLADEHPNAVAQLTLQYRMHEDICLLPNLLVYKGGLKCANDDVKSKKLRLNSFPRSLKTIIKPNNKGLGWLLPVLNPNKPVVFVNTDNIGQDLEFCGKGGNRSSSRGLVNDTELELSRFVVNGLLVCGLPPSSVGIISPYRAQVCKCIQALTAA
jgi:DNA replication ATP-dependent helicase Dna2